MPMLASADGDVSAAKAALNARAIAGLEAIAAEIAPDDDSPYRVGTWSQVPSVPKVQSSKWKHACLVHGSSACKETLSAAAMSISKLDTET